MNTVVYEETVYRKRAIEYTLRVFLGYFVSVSKSTLASLCEKKYVLREEIFFSIMNEIFHDKNVVVLISERSLHV